MEYFPKVCIAQTGWQDMKPVVQNVQAPPMLWPPRPPPPRPPPSGQLPAQIPSTQAVPMRRHRRPQQESNGASQTHSAFQEANDRLNRLQTETREVSAQCEAMHAKLENIERKAAEIDRKEQMILNRLDGSRDQARFSDLPRAIMAAMEPALDAQRSESRLLRDWLLGHLGEISKLVTEHCKVAEQSVTAPACICPITANMI